MITTLRITTPPAVEPVSSSMAIAHARIDASDEDSLITTYLMTARMLAEQFLGRALITQTLVWTIKDDPRTHHAGYMWRTWHRRRETLELPRAPVQSVSSVVFRDALGTDNTIDPSNLRIDTDFEPARVRVDWEGVEAAYTAAGMPINYPLEHIQVTFIAGYGDNPTNIPMPIINAILLMTAWLYEQRGDVGGEMPAAAESLLWPYRIVNFGA